MRAARKAKTKSALKAENPFFIILLVSVILAAISFFFVIDSPPAPKCANQNNYLRCHVELETVKSPREQAKGLSGRPAMPAHKGMVFVFDSPDKQCFWMKDMRFNIDIVWTSADYRIVKILKDVSPSTYPESFCAENAQYVIELKSGMADYLGYKVGDYIKL